ncbi:hypothetical protein D920_02301 [Enterococcus faecalis 13-SD-W-01]|nr:hypothetical protein D920_02301 [Enterococcus faecalis 13-SD-W-01]
MKVIGKTVLRKVFHSNISFCSLTFHCFQNAKMKQNPKYGIMKKYGQE